MSENATSLDRLHDIVPPAPVPWWPPAPGWYVVLAFLLGALAIVAIRGWRHWRRNAYRRAALRELAAADTAAAISELLRRTALATASRPAVAAAVDSQWPDWLAARFPEPMPDGVRKQLTSGAYAREDGATDVSGLRAYAARWIKGHQSPQTPEQQQESDETRHARHNQTR